MKVRSLIPAVAAAVTAAVFLGVAPPGKAATITTFPGGVGTCNVYWTPFPHETVTAPSVAVRNPYSAATIVVGYWARLVSTDGTFYTAWTLEGAVTLAPGTSTTFRPATLTAPPNNDSALRIQKHLMYYYNGSVYQEAWSTTTAYTAYLHYTNGSTATYATSNC